MKRTVIKAENLHKVYSRKTPFEHEALNDVSLEVQEGEFLAIIGETGSGKSSLITTFNALEKPSKGTVTISFLEKKINKETNKEEEVEKDFVVRSSKRKIKKINDLRKKVGMVFQFPEYQLFEETVLKDVMFGPKNFGVSKEESLVRANKYIDELKLPEDTKKRSPFDLSGGQKRKVALAGILAIETDIMIFDEPTAGLDPESEQEVLDICANLNKQGKTVIMITHNMENVLKYANRVIIMKESKVIHTGTPEQTFKNGSLMNKANLDIPRIYKFLQKYEKNENVEEEIKRKDELVDVLLGLKISKKNLEKKSTIKKTATKKSTIKAGDK